MSGWWLRRYCAILVSIHDRANKQPTPSYYYLRKKRTRFVFAVNFLQIRNNLEGTVRTSTARHARNMQQALDWTHLGSGTMEYHGPRGRSIAYQSPDIIGLPRASLEHNTSKKRDPFYLAGISGKASNNILDDALCLVQRAWVYSSVEFLFLWCV